MPSIICFTLEGQKIICWTRQKRTTKGNSLKENKILSNNYVDKGQVSFSACMCMLECRFDAIALQSRERVARAFWGGFSNQSTAKALLLAYKQVGVR